MSDFIIQFNQPGGTEEFEYNPELNQIETIENFIDQLDRIEPGKSLVILVERTT